MAEAKMDLAVKSTAHALSVEAKRAGGEKGTTAQVAYAELHPILGAWPTETRRVADTVVERYGPPNEATETRLIWHHNGPWKRTIVYRDEVPHNFPRPHTDILEQFVDYRVPKGKYDALADFDGSVVPERTKGEISARCDMEEMNFLALNLANEVCDGTLSVQEARNKYAEIATAFTMGEESPYTQGLLFEPRAEPDIDSPAPGPMIKEMMAKAKEAMSGS